MFNPFSPTLAYRLPTVARPGRFAPVNQRRFWIGFVLLLLAALSLNFLRLALTKGAAFHCGVEQTGFPFAFHEFGGYSPGPYFYPYYLAADLLIAFGFAYYGAQLLCRLTLRKRM